MAQPGAGLPMLFLVADTGAGHRASAAAVASRLQASAPHSFAPVILDPLTDAAPAVVARAAALYSPMIRHTPWLWGALYHATNSQPAVHALQAVVRRLLFPGVMQAVEALRPVLLVSFHPLLNHTAVQAGQRAPGGRIPVVTVITDLVDVHATWISREVDAVVTASPGAFDRCRRAGLPLDRCHDLGLPVDERFTDGTQAEGRTGRGAQRRFLRARLGLDASTFTVLITGGGEGSGGLRRRVEAILAARLPITVVAVCGRNDRLRAQLEALAGTDGRLRVTGFVDDMDAWTRAADVIVTKAGPGTIAEALCAEVPMLLTSYIPGQERGNVEYIVDTGAGWWVPRPSDLVEALRELSTPGSARLVSMQAAVRQTARPHATAQIAALVARAANGAASPVAAPAS